MKNRIKRIIAFLLFCVTLIGCGKLFRYILIDDTASYTRVTFHEMYEQDNIDILFVGSSHCYRSFIPEIFDKELGKNTFNVGTSSQSLDGSYMVIKEAARYHDIEHIYLELYYNCAFENYKNRTDMIQTYIISDYLRPSLDKARYLLDASPKDYYPNSFILARRNWPKFFDADYVKNVILKKQSDAYRKYDYTYISGELEWYAGKGYAANKSVIEDWNYFSTGGWSKINLDKISEDWLYYLQQIISFCKKRDIPLTLVSAPMPNYLLAGTENYDEYVELVRSTIKETNVGYYDFNLCKEEYFPNTSTLFKDVDHLNCYGAEIFSRLFAEFIKGKIMDDELFYDSYAKKLDNLEPTVFGISYHDDVKKNGEPVRNCKIVSTRNNDLQYEISLSPTEGMSYKIQNFSNNSFFTIAQEQHGVITIAYRLNNSQNKVWTVDISY